MHYQLHHLEQINFFSLKKKKYLKLVKLNIILGKILYKGFIIEDDNGMDTVEFLGISRFFSYFDYGMLYVDGSIRKSDMQRTFMDGYLPNYFNF